MSRTLVIPDIHGHLKAFNDLLQQIELSKIDHLYLLGDYIDRGPDSRGVVDRVMELIEQGYTVYPLRGNHEQMLLDSPIELQEYSFGSNKRKQPFLNDDEVVDAKYLDFFNSLAYYYELDDCFLAHAGINYTHATPLDDKWSMLWMRSKRTANTLDKTIIHGHSTYALSTIEAAIVENHSIIPLDNGVYKRQAGFGNLLCLDWGNRKLYKQPTSIV